MPVSPLRAPFPWFGGKSRAASIIWERFGDVANYIEPFAGSLAVLLARPTPPRIETVNDLDCMVANFWRAVQADPDAVAKWCDWPVNEADLHARHLWLVQGLPAHRERMMTEPDYFDAKIAGWWVWGSVNGLGRDGVRKESRRFSYRTSAVREGGSTGNVPTSVREWASTGNYHTSAMRAWAFTARSHTSAMRAGADWLPSLRIWPGDCGRFALHAAIGRAC